MKKRIYYLLVILSFISIIWVVQFSTAKYKDTSVLDISLTSAKMYFTDNASDEEIPYLNNTANVSFNVHNYQNQNYTIQNINYTISISNSNYTFNINNTSNAVENVVNMVLTGGERNSDTLNMYFTRLDTSNVPGTEDIVVTIQTTYPYTYSKSFTVTILNGAIEVQGNPTNWTRDDVTLTVVATTAGTTLAEYSFDNGETWQASSSKVYTENQDDITVYAKDSLGQVIGPVTIDITKIDKTPPTLTFATDNEHWKDSETDELELKEVETLIVYLNEATSVLTGVTATDTQSGISKDGVKCYRGETEITRTNYFTEVGRYAVTYKVQDEVGNETEATREILVRWPTGGRYVVAKTKIDGAGIAGEGLSISTSTDGLWKDTAATGANVGLPFASKYYYTGPIVDNYVSFAGSTFRIINVSTNDDIKLLGDVSDLKLAWQSSKIYESNTYNTWSTKWWPRGQIYNHEDGESKYKLFNETEKAHLDLATFYVGRLDNNSDDISYIVYNEQTNTDNLGGTESSSFQGYSAYPNVSDFMKASKAHDYINSLSAIDTTTVYSTRQRFKNNSWIDMTTEYWTMNGRTGSLLQNNDFWVIDNDQGGHFESRAYSTPQQYRVVFYLKDETILSGDGSSTTPYIVQENWSWFDPEQVVQ